MNVGSFVIFVFLVNVKPFETRFQNRTELFNECIILLLSYICWAYSDYLEDAELKFQLGWLYCCIMLFSILVNVSIMFYASVYLKIKAFYKKGKIKKRKAKKALAPNVKYY